MYNSGQLEKLFCKKQDAKKEIIGIISDYNNGSFTFESIDKMNDLEDITWI